MMPVFYEMLLRRTPWMQLSVQGGPDSNDRAARNLANRRAQAALRLLRQLGVRPDQVEVRIDYEGEIQRLDRDLDEHPQSPPAAPPLEWAANVIAMIPPEEVEQMRALAQRTPPVVVC
jgi:hypothetical protein